MGLGRMAQGDFSEIPVESSEPLEGVQTFSGGEVAKDGVGLAEPLRGLVGHGKEGFNLLPDKGLHLGEFLRRRLVVLWPLGEQGGKG